MLNLFIRILLFFFPVQQKQRPTYPSAYHARKNSCTSTERTITRTTERLHTSHTKQEITRTQTHEPSIKEQYREWKRNLDDYTRIRQLLRT